MVSADDRRRFERQAAALRTAECDDEGSLDWRHAVIESANRWRAIHGLAPLQTEGETAPACSSPRTTGLSSATSSIGSGIVPC